MLRFALALSIAVISPAVEAASGRCLLRVEGQTLLQGQCNVETEADGSFSIETADRPSDLTYFAMVNRQADGKMKGFWNGQKGATHAQTELGTLRQNGACWESPGASVCAWER